MIRNPWPFRYLTDWAYDMLLGTDDEVAQPPVDEPPSPPIITEHSKDISND